MQFKNFSKTARAAASEFEKLPNVEEDLQLNILFSTATAQTVFGVDFMDARPEGWAEIRYNEAVSSFLLLYYHSERTNTAVEWCKIELVANYGELPTELRACAVSQIGQADEREWRIVSPTNVQPV